MIYQLHLKKLIDGKKQDIKFSTSEKCNTCKGSGSKPGHDAGSVFYVWRKWTSKI